MLTNKLALSMIIPTLLVAGCGGNNTQGSSSFSLAVSDAPVDALSEVVICFNKIELTGNSAGGDDVQFTIDTGNNIIAGNSLCRDSQLNIIPNTNGIDLLQFTGRQSLLLVQNEIIPSGTYSQLRLVMSEGSYAIDAADAADAMIANRMPIRIPIRVPSNELKLGKFDAPSSGIVAFTVEFELRKSMTNPVGQDGYILKPTGLRLVDNSHTSHIEGNISEALLSNNLCSITPLVGEPSVAAVYLYKGFNQPQEELADNGGSESIKPYASTTVKYDGAGNYDFEMGFLVPGDYTVAVSCNINDDPLKDDNIEFIAVQNVTVTAEDIALLTILASS